MRTSSIFAILLAIVAAVGATPVKRESGALISGKAHQNVDRANEDSVLVA
ncbi:hypothetical protein B0F90DRAFT_1822758 [Multifurca ochricompacta]|uniref:RxLR effector protein n=1 Tax=Multifurca ochricompacta TaxID=376703 RepID=A0AAD4LWQ4_9AGAM|nr:hypothetical protein B0F90DRAFT_1822758 [Multifurca ochricompacta]